MGNLCNCQKGTDEPTAKTPLLFGKPQPMEMPNAITTSPGQTARRFKPDNKGFESSLDQLCPVSLTRIPTMPAMDKTFQDHAKLYNDLYDNFRSLREAINNFKSKFAVETCGIPIMSDCLRILAKRCGGATLTGSRSKNHIEIEYDKKEISEMCQGPAEDVLETLELYNKANKIIKRIMEQSSKVQGSIQMIIDDENRLKREVTKADPDGRLGPEPLRMTTENLIKLRKLPDRIQTIHRHTSKIFGEICKGSTPLFKNGV